MLGMNFEIGMEGSTVVEGGLYPNPWAHFVRLSMNINKIKNSR